MNALTQVPLRLRADRRAAPLAIVAIAAAGFLLAAAIAVGRGPPLPNATDLSPGAGVGPRLRAIEAELTSILRTADGIEDARIHISPPDESDLARATVLVRLSAPLTASQVDAIRTFVGGVDPRLPPQRVTILDDNANILADESTQPRPERVQK